MWRLRRDLYLELSGLPGNSVRKVMCRRCGLVYARPQLASSDLARLYSTFRVSEMPSPEHLAAKQRLADGDFEWLQLHLGAAGAAFEVGSSEGSFLHRLQQAGWQTTGVEPSAFAEFGRKTYGLDIRRGLFEEMEFVPASFDLVVALRVLEHIADPRGFLARVASMLKPDGLIYLEVPSAWKPRHALREFLGAQHLWLFTSGSLVRLLREQRFTRIAVDDRGRGLRVLARFSGSPSEHSHVDASEDRPSCLDPYLLRLVYARHQVKYFWKIRGRVALVNAARWFRVSVERAGR